jgi:uncharacterized membrane protein
MSIDMMNHESLFSTPSHLAAACFGSTLSTLPAKIWAPYLGGVAILAIGLAVIFRGEVQQAQGPEKILPFGRVFFALPLGVFGADHFAFSKDVAEIVPSWMPWHMFWVYFVGTALLAAALSFALKRHAELAAMLTGIMLFLFVATIHIPNIVAEPGNRFTWIIALRDLSFSGGALAFAGAQRRARGGVYAGLLVGVGRFFIAFPTIVFGVEHFMHPGYVPGIPLDRVTPAWIHGRIFWAYVAGAVLLGSGACLAVNWRVREAAIGLGMMVLLLVFFVYLPIMGASLKDIGKGLNYFADTLLFSGAALLLADALPKEDHGHA